MVYEIPASKASFKQNVFEFKIPGQKKVSSLPLQQYITASLREELSVMAGTIIEHQEAGTEPSQKEMLEIQRATRKVLEHYQPGIYDVLDSEQIGELVKAWGAASKAQLGESSASAGS